MNRFIRATAYTAAIFLAGRLVVWFVTMHWLMPLVSPLSRSWLVLSCFMAFGEVFNNHHGENDE